MTYDSNRVYEARLKVPGTGGHHWTDWLQWEAQRLGEKCFRKAELEDEEVAFVVWKLNPKLCKTSYNDSTGEAIIVTSGDFKLTSSLRGWSLNHDGKQRP